MMYGAAELEAAFGSLLRSLADALDQVVSCAFNGAGRIIPL